MWALLLVLVATAASATAAPVYRLPLTGSGSASLAWALDYGGRQLRAEVHCSEPADWMAVGFSDRGDFAPADYCVMWRDWRGRVHMQDTWTDEEGAFHVDEQQDCKNFRYVSSHDVTKFTFSRKFDTCDEHDYVIEEGTTHVVWASGRSRLFAVAGLNVSSPGVQRAMQRAQLLRNEAAAPRLPADAWPLEVRASHVRVPSSDTTYWCHVQRLPQELRRKHHIVQYEAVIQEGNEPLVHHMEVFHCEAPPEEQIPEYQGSCTDEKRPKSTAVCKKVLAAWAMGALPFTYPEEAGLPIGGPGFNPYVMLEVHYNNPELRSDWVDSSGVRLHLTSELRLFDGGVIELGLEYTDKMAIPPKQPAFTLSGYCITECTAVGIPPEGITIFGSQLHTHLTGIRVYTRHIRDGREMPELNRDNHYSTHFQEIRLLKRPVTILPGDALITTCTYNTEDRENITLGGFAISEEMCVNYVHYYPKVDLEVCKSSVSSESLKTYFRFLHEWEGQPTSPDNGISSNYGSIDWTPIRVSVLNQLYQESPLSMQCNQSSGERFPGAWENLPVTQVQFPLPPPSRPACDTKQ
ncbi:dopamine beta-hydroxylase [Schistocerca americana]|uniref:dopamine beta-hydroxylase n=1 Tax=Schistocerca americana TaxID=7009 RepID=UPI001F4FF8AC|nr:dopamine beta-hydroxylase [Schistocerca americana]